MKTAFACIALCALTTLGAVPPANAAPVETAVTIRVRAHDAKFIGSGTGGMNVVVEEIDTGKVLATGQITGGTGDTDRLMKKPVGRADTLANDGSASYVATLRLDRPTRVRIRAVGPLAEAQSVQEMTVTTWVVPGRPIGGDGIVLEMPGLIVSPQPQPATKGRIPLVADVKLMCGCPITQGGLWNSDDYEVGAILSRAGTPEADAELSFTGETNRFAGSIATPAAGRYEVTLWAHNSKTGNTGAASYTLDVP